MLSRSQDTGEDADRPLSQLLSDMTGQLQQLLRKEMELARIETKEEISRATKGIGAFGGAGAVGLVSLILLAFAAAAGLAEVIATPYAFLIVGGALLCVAGALAATGKANMSRFNPVPQQTVETVKEDLETAKGSLQRGLHAPDTASHSSTTRG